jgi:hypothetical protein
VSTKLYGHSHFLAVAKLKMNVPSVWHLLSVMVFAAATTPLIALCGALSLWDCSSKRRWGICALMAVALVIGYLSGFHASVAWQWGFWLGCFFWWFTAVATQPIDDASRFLMAWSLLGLFVIVVAIRWVCARYLVIASPAWILLSLRFLENRFPSWLRSQRVRCATALGLLLFGLSLAVEDWQHAHVDELVAKEANSWRMQHLPGSPAFYPAALLGGLEYYLPDESWVGLQPSDSVPPGGILLLSTRTLPPTFWPQFKNPRRLAEFSYRSFLPWRTLDGLSGAGFYGSIWGPLPYSLSRAPLDVYVLLVTASSN